MSLPIHLIVGLGNPGTKYAKTRHNAGAWFVENLAKQAGCQLRSEAKFHGLHTTAQFAGKECQLLIPTTYMNNSGLAVQATARFYKIPPESILVVHDEMDLPAGIARLKFDGGAGGHNGLKDLIDRLQTKQFHRLRIGVDRPTQNHEVIDYVLNAPSKAERQLIDESLERAQGVLEIILEGDFQKAMQHLHTD